MLENVESIFDGMSDMMKKLKKASYEKNMKGFRDKNGHFFVAITNVLCQPGAAFLLSVKPFPALHPQCNALWEPGIIKGSG